MTRAGSGWMPVILLLAIAALTFWLERSVQGEKGGDAPRKNAPDFWARDFTVRNFDAEGAALHTVTATRMTHFADRDTIELASPRVQLRNDGVATVRAERGMVGPEGERIDLYGRVVVERHPPGADAVVSVLRTEHLTLYPDRNEANSPVEVAIERPGTQISGRGLATDQNTGVTTLQGRVRATMEPRKKS